MDIKQATILVVDDNDSMRRLMRLMLRDLGTRDVLLAATVDEAFAILEGQVVDAILTDWEMEGGTGLHLLRRLRASGDGRLRRLPVVMVTAHAECWRVASARDAGASEFLVKPISPAQMAAKLRSALLLSRPFIRSEGYCGPDRRRSQRPFFGPERRQGHAGAPNPNPTETSQTQITDARNTYNRLRGEFETFLADAAQQIARDARNLRLKPDLAAEIAQRIYRLAHNIKGQGSSFDYPLATEIATELCRFLKQQEAAAPPFNDRDVAVISGHAAAFDAIARNKVTGSGGELGQRILARLRGFVAV